MKKIGFIGAGNMGSAIIKGIEKNKSSDRQIYVFDLDQNKVSLLESEYGVNSCDSLKELVSNCEYIFLCVKPNIIPKVLEQIKNDLDKDRHVLISIAVGVTIKSIKDKIGNDEIKVVRTMPNMPAHVLEGMTVVCFDDIDDDEIIKDVKDLFNSIGDCEILKESLMSEVTALTGSSPAYVYMIIEAMADGAVLLGIGREQAYRMAAKTLLGSAKMVLESNEHPGVLKDMVCSPGGTTIEAVRVLETMGLRGAIIEAMKACNDRAIEIGKGVK